MALALTVSKQYAAFGGYVVVFSVVASGSYATGGDVASITGLAGLTPTSIPLPSVTVNGSAGFVYQWLPGTTQALGKIKVFIPTAAGGNIPMAEHSAAAYAAGVTGDTITATAFFGPV